MQDNTQQPMNPIEQGLQMAKAKQQMMQMPSYGAGTGAVLPSLGAGQPYMPTQTGVP